MAVSATGFETRDFYLACFLRCTGYELLDLRAEGRRKVFVFRDRPSRRRSPKRRDSARQSDSGEQQRKTKFPTWEEAISVLIESNIKNHSKSNRGGSSSGTGGGRGRSRGRGRGRGR